MADEVYFNPEEKTFVINGEIYKLQKQTTKKKSGGHASKEILVKIDKKEYDARIEAVIDYLQAAFDGRKFLKSYLENLPLSDIEMIERRMKKGVKVKEKGGCYNLEIGNMELNLSE